MVASEARSTILLNKNGNRYVPYLIWNDGRWQLNWNWLDNNFNRNYRFLRLRNSSLVFMKDCAGFNELAQSRFRSSSTNRRAFCL